MSGKRLRNLLKMAFGLGVLGWIAWQLQLSELIALARQGDPRDFALGSGFLLLAMLGLQWSRLHLLIKSYTPSLAVSLKIFFVGALFNNFLPSNIGGDAVRILYLKNLRSEGWGGPLMLLVLYRLSSFALLVLSGLTYVLLERERLLALLSARQLAPQPNARTFLIAGSILLLLAAGAFVLRRRLSERLRARLAQFVAACRTGFDVLSRSDWLWLGLQTALFQLCRMLSLYFLVRYMGQQVALWDLLFVVSATALIAVLPVTVAGLGVMEASITGLLVMYGVELSSAGAVALMNRAVLLLSAAIGGVIYLRSEAVHPSGVAPAKRTVTSA